VVPQRRVLRLYSDGKVPEGAMLESWRGGHGECPLPILSEVISAESTINASKDESDQTITLGADPVAHTTVKNTSYDEGELIIGDDLLVNEKFLQPYSNCA